MSELDELIAQRKEIDRRIRELRNTSRVCGRVKYEIVNFPRGREHTVFVRKKGEDAHLDRYYGVIALTSKNEMLLELNTLIEDLRALETMLKEGEE